MLHVVVTNPERVLYDGAARCVVFPGEKGTFEVWPLHRPIMSRLVSGVLKVDNQVVKIKRGLMRCAHNEVVVIVEL